MYSLSDAAKTAFKNNHKEAEITFFGTEETRLITSEYIWGLELTRASVSGDTIAIGEFCASTLTLTLNNGDGYFNDLKFSGGYMYVLLKTTDSNGNTYYLPLGYYLVDEAPRKTKKITVECYDRAVLFDHTADFTDLSFPASLSTIADYCVKKCVSATGMEISTDIESLPNGKLEVEEAPDDDLTYRQVLMAIAEITGTVAHMNAGGDVEFSFYSQTGESLTTAERYDHDLYEDDTVITGVQITDADGSPYLAGSDTYAFAIEDNALLTGDNVDYGAIAANIYAAVQAASVDSDSNFYYRAFEAEIVSMPYLEPLDIITYVEPDGTEHPAIITNFTYVMNGKGKIEGKSDSPLEQELSSVGSLTANQKAILKKVQTEAAGEITTRELAILSMNESILNGLGLYKIAYTDESGATTYYFADSTELENASIIYCFNSGGFVWTDDWNSGEPVWKHGITSAGNAILNLISADKISANQIYVSEILSNESGAIKIAANRLTIESDNFTLDADGTIHATNAYLSGTIETSDGIIGGFTIGESALYNGKTAYDDGVEGVYLGTDGIGVGAYFYATRTGEVYAKKIYVSGGTIGDFVVGKYTEGQTYSAIYVSALLDFNPLNITFYSGSGTYMSYANLDYNGLGSLYRTSNTSQYPYIALDCYAENGLRMYYYPSSTGTVKQLGAYLDSSNSYYPTLYSSTRLYLTATTIYLNATTTIAKTVRPQTTNTYSLGSTTYRWNAIYAKSIDASGDISATNIDASAIISTVSLKVSGDISVGDYAVSTPYVTVFASIKGYINETSSSGTTPTGKDYQEEGTIIPTVIKCGDMIMICLDWNGEFSTQRWAKFDLSGFVTTVYCAQVAGRATSTSKLDGNGNLSTEYTIYIDGAVVYVGNNSSSHKAGEGLKLFVIGF